MPALITFGRILFAVLFLYSGASKLFGIQATADVLAAKVTIPAIVAPYAQQIETFVACRSCSCWRLRSVALRSSPG